MKQLLALAALLAAMLLSAADAPKAGVFLLPELAGPDFKVQGEYAGEKLGAQVIALGDGKFRAVFLRGGLPGAGWDKSPKVEIEGSGVDGKAVFGKAGGWTGGIVGEVLSGKTDTGVEFNLKKVFRKSPTLGAKPPAGALVLFDGASAEHFSPGRLTADGLLAEGANSKRRFQSQTLHLEFFLPFQPAARGQGRANSGCYLQGRYEVQVLDSFGLKGENNECGGIYTIAAPAVNMCLPPLAWQTYDIEFTAAKFDAAGNKVEEARITVLHNGVKIHDNLKLPKGTTAAPLKEGPEPGFLHLQNHGNPVRYRNIWVVER
jgi:hypothetical protein